MTEFKNLDRVKVVNVDAFSDSPELLSLLGKQGIIRDTNIDGVRFINVAMDEPFTESGQNQMLFDLDEIALVDEPEAVEADKPMTDATANRLAEAMEELAHELSLLDTVVIEELTDALNHFNK